MQTMATIDNQFIYDSINEVKKKLLPDAAMDGETIAQYDNPVGLSKILAKQTLP